MKLFGSVSYSGFHHTHSIPSTLIVSSFHYFRSLTSMLLDWRACMFSATAQGFPLKDFNVLTLTWTLKLIPKLGHMLILDDHITGCSWHLSTTETSWCNPSHETETKLHFTAFAQIFNWHPFVWNPFTGSFMVWLLSLRFNHSYQQASASFPTQLVKNQNV